MTDAHLLLYLLLPLALLAGAFVVWQNVIKPRQERAVLTASKCGEVPHPGGTMDPSAWFTGPVLPPEQGGNKSPGMPLHPTTDSAGGLVFDFPVAPFETTQLGTGDKFDSSAFCHGPLTGRARIRLRYRLDPLDPSAEVYSVPETAGADKYKARITPFFQEKGDDELATPGGTEPFRWYFDLVPDLHYLEAGEHEIVASFAAGWGATQTSTQENNPAGFKAAFDNCCCVGFVIGGNEVGLGHGGRATAPARLTILEFTVE